jgi:hypothetical protein
MNIGCEETTMPRRAMSAMMPSPSCDACSVVGGSLSWELHEETRVEVTRAACAIADGEDAT